MTKLSELSLGTFVSCNNEVMTAERAIEKAKAGEALEVYLITYEYIENVLDQCWEQHKNGNVTEKLSALNNGEKVIVDICNFCGYTINLDRYKQFANGQKACMKCLLERKHEKQH